jgi:hypothetical protein
MTYTKQLKEYEEKVMLKRFEEPTAGHMRGNGNQIEIGYG